MGKVANRKRKDFFAELLKQDSVKKAEASRPQREANCCLNKYKSKLPDHFVKCYNCPLDTSGETC